jgi:fructose-1,6-bisphosphatase II
MLFNGERIGTGHPPEVDVAVDPIDGTRLVAQGQANALSVVAVAGRGAMFNPGPCVYMEKIVTGREAGGAIDIAAPVEDNIRNVARAKGLSVSDVTVMILDRPRHEEIVNRMRKIGARVYLLPDGDVAGAIAAARRGTGVDLLYGIGGTPEGVVAAAALKCLGGVIQGRLYPRDDAERKAAIAAGYDLGRVLTVDDLVKGDDVFFACTGITDGALVQGVRFFADGATTESIVTRASSGTIRVIRGEHRVGKLKQIYGEES